MLTYALTEAGVDLSPGTLLMQGATGDTLRKYKEEWSTTAAVDGHPRGQFNGSCELPSSLTAILGTYTSSMYLSKNRDVDL